ncbi:protease inhibitor Inh/omp19 family protein [Pseudomonas aeruginosa]|uniref:protease inhibitor Inh/omp19 family protein n=1 Tax=Pseudomonas aeruginosa TaxID=287 RepID=UPI00071BD97B|nr:protease inhibitor Inh/omp19 family protein [Pseudomonas aeruginosa]KSR45919.1 proteinase inhibitor [Pseudomonas aeruginosa]RPV04869.1 proteinase inhibitor [Pseudomonas aeruginosa]
MSASAKLSRMVCLLTGFFSTGISMASSLILPSATDLAGRWTLQQDEAPAICQLELRASEVAEASGYALGGDTACLKHWLPSEPSAWRPTPAGIALLERDGLTLMLLGRQGEGDYRVQKGDGGQLVLRRVAP